MGNPCFRTGGGEVLSEQWKNACYYTEEWPCCYYLLHHLVSQQSHSKGIRRVYFAFWLSLTDITVIPRNICIRMKSFNFSLSNGYWCLILWYIPLGTCSCIFGSFCITMSALEQAHSAFKARSHEPSVEQLQQRSEGELHTRKVRRALQSCLIAHLGWKCQYRIHLSAGIFWNGLNNYY